MDEGLTCNRSNNNRLSTEHNITQTKQLCKTGFVLVSQLMRRSGASNPFKGGSLGEGGRIGRATPPNSSVYLVVVRSYFSTIPP